METKKCPYCGKTVLALSKVCKYCRQSFEQKSQNENIKSTPETIVPRFAEPPIPAAQQIVHTPQQTQFNESWQKTTQSIYNGVLLYSLSGIVYAILNPISKIGGTLSYMSGSNETGGLSIFCNFLLIGIIVGYFMYLNGLNGFSKILTPGDSAAIKKVYNSVILVLIAEIFGFIPLFGWIGSILRIISFIMMLMGYAVLKKSQTFPKRANLGASKLFSAMILLLIGVVLGSLPLSGRFLQMPFDIIAFILTLTGWAAIKNTIPSEESKNTIPTEESKDTNYSSDRDYYTDFFGSCNSEQFYADAVDFINKMNPYSFMLPIESANEQLREITNKFSKEIVSNPFLSVDQKCELLSMLSNKYTDPVFYNKPGYRFYNRVFTNIIGASYNLLNKIAPSDLLNDDDGYDEYTKEILEIETKGIDFVKYFGKLFTISGIMGSENWQFSIDYKVFTNVDFPTCRRNMENPEMPT